MKNSILYIVGGVVLLGGGAFLFLKNKNKKDEIRLADLQTKKAMEIEKTNQQTKLSVDDLLAIVKLKEQILANIIRKGTYRTQGSRDAVQRDIDKQIIELKAYGKTYGFTFGDKNELVKIN